MTTFADDAVLLAIDQGTTGSTAVLIGRDLRVIATANQEYRQIYPQPGWVEHDPSDIWRSVKDAVLAVLRKTGIDASRIAAIGITNQRETTVVWNRESGTPVHNAIVWQCRRTADVCHALRDQGHQEDVQARTGLVLDAYFSGTKVSWILDNVNGARADADAGRLAFGTIDCWLTWRLTGGVAHVTDFSNASRTLLMNLEAGAWDDHMCALLRVPAAVLPTIRSNAEVYGVTKGLDFLPDGIPVAGMAGDQQAALFGQACFEAGEAKCTYGTGAFLLMNTGSERVPSKNGMLTTGAWLLDGTPTYAIEGSAFIAGAVVQWLRDQMQFFTSSAQVEDLAASVPDSGGVVVVPALAGLGAPHWNPEARGVIWGITRGTDRAHIARAALEGIAFQCGDILTAMQKDLGRDLSLLRVDGGAAANNLLMQFQCDILNVAISRPRVLETTALGAGLFAGLGVGFFEGLDAIRANWAEERQFHPSMDAETRAAHLQRWEKGLARV